MQPYPELSQRLDCDAAYLKTLQIGIFRKLRHGVSIMRGEKLGGITDKDFMI